VGSVTAAGRPAATLKSPAPPDPERRSFGRAIAGASGSSCKTSAKEFAVFMRQFDDRRIPPSPLQDL
jgi:hypothetical protein